MNRRTISYISVFLMLLAPSIVMAKEDGETITSVTINKHIKKPVRAVNARINMDFNDVDIKDFIKVISKITGKDFILSQNVSGKVTIISPTPVTLEEVWRIFESVLQVNNLTTVGSGNVMKIVPLNNAKGTEIGTYFGRKPEHTSDAYITQVVPMHYITSSDMANVIRPFLSPFGNIQTYDPTNTLIITDAASNINRLLKIIQALDKDIYKQTIDVIKLHYATAQSVSNIITSLFAGTTTPSPGFFRPAQPGGVQQQIKVLYDDRTNSLIIVANTDMLESIKQLIAKLDVPVNGEGQIHVYYLKNANAKELATTLASLAGGGSSSMPVVPGHPQQAGAAVAQFQGGVKITADPATNSLIIISTPKDYQTIKGVIKKLDIARRQVYVQAIIAELSLSRANQFGVDLLALPNFNAVGTQLGAGSNMGAGLTTLPSTTNPLGPFGLTGLSLGIIKGTVTLNGVTYPNIVSFLNALQTDSEANVLSTPNILATDNEAAEIMVGENVPVPTGQAVGQISGYSQTYIQRQDVGLKLKITPQINAGDYVRLKLNFDLTAIIASPQGLSTNTYGITTSKRSEETVVTVKNGSTIIIGGLIQDQSSVSESKIPLLGDIPIIGWLFRYSNKSKNKTDLMIFLTPYIVRGQADIAAINRMKEAQSKEFEKKTFGYELKNSPFKSAFKGLNTSSPASVQQPAPLLFTGETYITPEGEMTSQMGVKETGETFTSGAALSATSTSTITSGTGILSVNKEIKSNKSLKVEQFTPATTAMPPQVIEKKPASIKATEKSIPSTEPITGTTFTAGALKQTETTIP